MRLGTPAIVICPPSALDLRGADERRRYTKALTNQRRRESGRAIQAAWDARRKAAAERLRLPDDDFATVPTAEI